MNELRVYQKAAAFDVLRVLRPGNPVVLVSPTASGKTVIAAEIARTFKNVLFVAHRREIIKQARDVMPDHVTCASIQRAWSLDDEFDLLIIDEAHRSAARTYKRLIERHAGKALLGLTATPLRMDGKTLKGLYEELISASSVSQLLSDGYLVPFRALEAPDEALRKLDKLKIRAGDYDQQQLAEVMNRPKLVGDVVSEYERHARGRKSIAFAVNIEHSILLEQEFLSAGIAAVHIDGRASEKQRDQALSRLVKGEVDVLCSVNLFTEGWDCPAVSCVIMARPTMSLTLYLQSVGRGLRPFPGKDDLLILDHAGNISRHGYPDQDREWFLESPRELKKREKDIRRLERMYALGQVSTLEGYSLEEKRLLDANIVTTKWMLASISQILGYAITDGSVGRYLKSAAVRPKGFGLWDRADAENFLAKMSAEMDKTVRIADAAQSLGMAIGVIRSRISRLAIPPLGTYLSGRILKSDVERIGNIENLGIATKDVAASFRKISNNDVGDETVGKYLKNAGVRSISPGIWNRGEATGWLADATTQLERSAPIPEVADDLSLTRGGLQAWISKLEIEPLSGYLNGRIFKADVERINSARANGDRRLGFLTPEQNSSYISIREISERTGLNKWALRHRLKKEGIKPTGTGGRFRPRPICEELIKAHLAEVEKRKGYIEVREAADILGCHHKHVRKILREHGADAAFHNAYIKEQVLEVAHLQGKQDATTRAQAETVRT